MKDIDRHRVMLPHAKNHHWELWNINFRDWKKEHWDDFNRVKEGLEPELLGRAQSGRKKDIYVATKGETVIEGCRIELSEILGVHKNTIIRSLENNRLLNGFKIIRK